MSSNLNITGSNITAPTPQNTPLNQAPIALGLSRPTVPDITEDNEQDEGDGADVDLGAVQTQMLGMVHGRLAELVGKSSGYIESLPVEVKLNIEGLKGIQVKQNELQNQYKRECLELEKKYLGLQKPLYERRHAIISGTAQPTREELDSGEQYSIKEDEEYTPLPKDVAPSAEGIPHFWLTALRNHIALSELITDRDVEALKHLVDVQLAYLDDKAGKPGFKILFIFSANDFFENDVLEKTYLYQEEVGYSGDFVYDRAIGSEIRWKEDKDLTKEFEIKKQRNKNTNRTRLVRKAKPTESFFNFFTPPIPPSEEAIENGDFEDEELEEIEEKLEVDYQIGEDIKEKIIPRAIDFFTGKALEYEGLDDDDDDAFEDLDDDDDEGQFDEDDSESDNDVPVRRRGPPKGRGGAPANASNVNPEECKQQ
ncbi:nucleosome assembly protein [Laccaria bicolor S238N-H82]|uniref:Nucleosome assembly protein n=1 Tax=Laccaria bicolor (strain S238N-H82 / ATCC MYA-4686) TaxID=486041 RepID=B0DGW9_LACBS|nr:nucleosome assembly protein [Laccaria bicolor S238N-H82]EDR06222.1 nucleosome assembly protein [Laccaria bicolor S238N-H82]|eukprot:XP_001883083.1 nucleosome assembly protein [Laccaria bicolor S238N-H82]